MPELTIGIVVPVLNEAARLESNLAQLLQHDVSELIIVDGGSQDGSRVLAQGFAQAHANIKLITCAVGRAAQMNAGASAISTDIVCFVHADTTLPDDALIMIRRAVGAGQPWGRFDVRFTEPHLLLKIVARSMNWRSALTGVCTGDQCIWVQRTTFESVGGYAEIPLMEDIDLSKRLRKIAAPYRIKAPVTTSARRWLEHGTLRTIALMWWLRFLYWIGVPAHRLTAYYR